MSDLLPADARPIPPFPGYFATPSGEIWTTKQGVTKRLAENHSGRYATVTPCVAGRIFTRQVHALILETFDCPKPAGLQARHLNGKNFDNRASNLRWGTVQDNADDRIRHGTTAKGMRNGKYTHPEKTPRGSGHWNAKLSPENVSEIRRMRAAGYLLRVIADRFGIGTSQVCRIAQRSAWDRDC